LVRSKIADKVVLLSSILGVLSPPMVDASSATKHAVQAIAEATQDATAFRYSGTNDQCGSFFTDFNETMVDAAYRWLDGGATFRPCLMVKEITNGLLAKPGGRLDPI